MATSTSGGIGRPTGLPGRARYRPMADINVTPFVDVMLVLLIVFMVTAPLLTVGVPVNLPKTQAPTMTEPKQPLVISVNAQGQVFIQDTEVDIDSLVTRLEAVTEDNPDAVLYVRGDKAVDYGRVLQVMSLISAAGFHKVSLVAQAEGTPAPGRPAPHAGGH